MIKWWCQIVNTSGTFDVIRKTICRFCHHWVLPSDVSWQRVPTHAHMEHRKHRKKTHFDTNIMKHWFYTTHAHSLNIGWFSSIASHYNDVIMGTVGSQITSLTILYSTIYSDADLRKHQSSASLAFVQGIHRGPVNSPHKWPVTRKIFPFDDVIKSEVGFHEKGFQPHLSFHYWVMGKFKDGFKFFLN